MSSTLVSATSRGCSHKFRTIFALIFAVVFVASLSVPAWAARAQVIHRFHGKDGIVPQAGLIFDGSGNLYGTASSGGAYGNGTVFELTPKAGGGWKETVLHSFNGTDGAVPLASVIFDSAGNLYGTTAGGGSLNCSGGCGTVFELSPQGGGRWTEQVLYSFGGPDGSIPEASLIFDSAGNLYGTTAAGGTGGVGTVFELSPRSGSWSEQVLHSFDSSGGRPYGALVSDAAGNLYGTTAHGGAKGEGSVFELVRKAGGRWGKKVLFSFHGADGMEPFAGLVFDGSGNLYGTTASGGAYNYGTVFELSPKAGGGWQESVLLSFNDYPDGANPVASLVFDSAGNLYGTTYGGGTGPCQYGCGTVFELSPSGGSWTETVIVDFQEIDLPRANVTLGASGILYGTTAGGGAHGWGTVFESKY